MAVQCSGFLAMWRATTPALFSAPAHADIAALDAPVPPWCIRLFCRTHHEADP